MSDADEHCAGAVILKDLALFNKAAVFLENKIQPEICSAVVDLVSDWLKEHGWKGETDVSDDLEEMWVCPASWEEEAGEPFAKFNFGYRTRTDTNSYQIADLFGVGQSDLGFRFEVNYGLFGGRNGWKKTVNELGEFLDEVIRNGWGHDGKGEFFRPVTLPAGLLVSSWKSGDWSEALAPLERELDALRADQALFYKIIMRASPTAA